MFATLVISSAQGHARTGYMYVCASGWVGGGLLERRSRSGLGQVVGGTVGQNVNLSARFVLSPVKRLDRAGHVIGFSLDSTCAKMSKCTASFVVYFQFPATRICQEPGVRSNCISQYLHFLHSENRQRGIFRNSFFIFDFWFLIFFLPISPLGKVKLTQIILKRESFAKGFTKMMDLKNRNTKIRPPQAISRNQN